MNDFSFHAPESLKDALELLSKYDGDARVMSGGTALMLLLKQSLVNPDHIISLHRVPEARAIQVTDGVLHVGGLVTQREMELSSVVREATPLLANAYSRVATVRIRNSATVGGGLAQADPAMDPPSSLLVLNASVKVMSASGERVIPIADWYSDYYETTINEDEIVTELLVPVQPTDMAWTYIKYLPRTEDDYATVSVAALGKTANGKISEVRVGLGAVSSTALRASDLEAALQGADATFDVLKDASQAVAGIVDPTSDPRGSADYKRDMSVVFARRALQQVLGVQD
jgi:aerobic carbon-monoxide dehydrogenase medium subunit